MNKKLFLKLGGIVAISSPIVSAVACSPGTEMTEKDAKMLYALTNDKMIRYYNQKWLSDILKKNGNTEQQIEDREIKMAQNYINHNLYKKQDFLISWETKFKSIINDKDKVTINGKTIDGEKLKTDLDTIYKMNANYNNFTEWQTAIGGPQKFQDFVKTYIIDKQKIDGKPTEGILGKLKLKINIDKNLVAENYLNLTKDKWDKVFIKDKGSKNYLPEVKEDLGGLYGALGKVHYPLNKLGVEKKYAYKWSIKLNKDDTWNLREKPDITAEQMINQFTNKTDSIGSLIKPSRRGSKVLNSDSVFKTNVLGSTTTTDQEQILGFEGLASMGGSKGQLNFEKELDVWKEKTNLDKLVGFIKNNALISGGEKISFKEKETDDTINRVLFRAIIPTYIGKEVKFDTNKFDLNKLISYFVLNNSSIYENAEAYYTDKNSDDYYLLTFNDAEVWQRVKDKSGFNFIKAKDE